jgi:hypothetical protein
MGGRRPPQPERYAAQLAAELDAARQRVASGRVTIERRLRTMVSESGWLKRSRQNMSAIAMALASADVFSDVDLTDLARPLSSWISLSDTPFPTRALSRMMVNERALNRFLALYHDAVFDGVDGLEGLEYVGSEVKMRYEGEVRRIDLLFRDRDGTRVAIETERGDPQQNSVFQLRGYLDALAATGVSARGVLVTARPQSAQLEGDIIEELAEVEYPTTWLWYDVAVRLERLDDRVGR